MDFRFLASYNGAMIRDRIRRFFSRTSSTLSEGDVVLMPVSVQRVPRFFRISRGPLEHIAWPLIDPHDDVQVLHYNKFKRELTTHLGGRYFSVCDIDYFLRSFDVALTPATAQSYDMLHRMHCVDFRDIPPLLYAQLPHLINHVISGGQIVHPLLDNGTGELKLIGQTALRSIHLLIIQFP